MKRVREFFARLGRRWGETYWKRIMTIVILNALGWIWCSYILAWFGREQIADDLSKTALSTIFSVVIAYAAKSTAENISKHGYVGKQKPEEHDGPWDGSVPGKNSGSTSADDDSIPPI